MMDKIVMNLPTPEKCESFMRNAKALGRHELVRQARERAVQLRAESHGADTPVERAALQAVYAYQEAKSAINGKKTNASRTWQMIKKRGIIDAVESAVNRPSETDGYNALVEMGLEAYTFENVILKYPESFSEKAIEISMERMNQMRPKV